MLSALRFVMHSGISEMLQIQGKPHGKLKTLLLGSHMTSPTHPVHLQSGNAVS